MEQIFRIDNTQGYTLLQLDELNRRCSELITPDMDEDQKQAISEMVQKKFDIEYPA